MRAKERKILKKISLATLAVVMATAGIFAFVPISANASPPPTTSTGLGLDPKNDPVVYTTESGLEIKMSNANKFSGTTAVTTNAGSTYTQDLSSFYYFTMGTFSGTINTAENVSTTMTVANEPVNWIILGVGSHSTAFVESVSNYLFSTIKNNDYLFSNGEYYFDNQHETFSPAGQLIDSTISAKTYIMGKVKTSIPVHTDIPKGCMLVISEKLLGSTHYNSLTKTGISLYTDGTYNLICYDNYYGNRYRYVGNVKNADKGAQTWTESGNAGSNLYQTINNLFQKDTSGNVVNNSLGFTDAQARLIVPQQLYTYYSNGPNYPLAETPSSDGSTYYTMFPLAYRAADATIKQNFCIEDYLTTNAKRISCLIGTSMTHTYWLRSGSIAAAFRSFDVAVTGSLGTTAMVRCEQGVRPAMVMKLN